MFLKIIFRTFLIVVCCVTGLLASQVFAQEGKFPQKNSFLLNELLPDQQRIVQNGGQVIITTPVPKRSPWPAIKIYQIVSALPEEIIAVFFDYEAAPTYVPHLKYSAISKKIDPRTHEIDYSLNIPLMPNERYTVRNSLHILPGDIYTIDWKLLRATTTRASEGNIRVESYGKNSSIICYSNLVVPGSRLAAPLRSIALDQVKKNVEALIKQVAMQKKKNPASLRRQIQVLRQALQ